MGVGGGRGGPAVGMCSLGWWAMQDCADDMWAAWDVVVGVRDQQAARCSQQALLGWHHQLPHSAQCAQLPGLPVCVHTRMLLASTAERLSRAR